MDFFNRIYSKVNQYLTSISLATRFYFLLCTILFLLECLNIIQIYKVCLAPYAFLNHPIQNVYKIFTANYFHLNILHILFNMLALLSIGPRLERQKFGTFQLFYLISLFSILISLMNVFISLIASFVGIGFGYYSCSIGFSSIIFSLLEIEFFEDRLVSLYGITNIPSKLYPFAILFITYLIFPSSSFIGHLSGILIGLLYVKGYLGILLLSPEKYIQIELSDKFNKITNMNGFITNINYGNSTSFYNNNHNSNNNSGSVNSSSSSNSLDNGLLRIKNYFTRNGNGQQLGTMSPSQRSQLQQQQNREISQTSTSSSISPNSSLPPISLTQPQPSINNIDDVDVNNNSSNNGFQIPMYSSNSLQYSPLIDMSNDNPQANNKNENK